MSEAYAELGGCIPRAPAGETRIDDATALWLVLLLQKLKRVVTRPGSGDLAFIRELRAVHPQVMSPAQRAHVVRLAWRYRFQLPPALRPANPDLLSEERAGVEANRVR